MARHLVETLTGLGTVHAQGETASARHVTNYRSGRDDQPGRGSAAVTDISGHIDIIGNCRSGGARGARYADLNDRRLAVAWSFQLTNTVVESGRQAGCLDNEPCFNRRRGESCHA